MSDATTIKVSRQLRDRLQTRARAEGRTMSAVVEALLERTQRAERFEQLRRAGVGRSGGDAETQAWEQAELQDSTAYDDARER